jgi:hypothetical protein
MGKEKMPHGVSVKYAGGGQGTVARQGNESMKRWVEDSTFPDFRAA